MALNGKQILEELEATQKNDRGRVTLYLSKSVYKAFADSCGEIPVSKVLERLLKDFVASAGERKGKGRK